jgi:tripartite-type tricarboxylate transporter receptor subunit TctC
MKKMLLALLLSAFTAFATAQTIVPVVWVFALSSTQGLMVREIINEANSIQNKYQFVFEHKAGAGGAVGVNYVANLNQPAILAHTASFFIRPYMSQEGSYDPEQFSMLNNYCADQPLAMVSKNFKTLADLQKSNKASVGVLPGSITNLVVAEYKKQNTKIDLVELGFKGTPEMATSVLGGHLDLSIDWLTSVMVHNELNILGTTGVQNHGRAKSFKSQGISGYEKITNSYYLLVNKNANAVVVQEFNDIMSRAVTAKRVQNYCTQEFGHTVNIAGPAARDLFVEKHKFWQQAVGKIVK